MRKLILNKNTKFGRQYYTFATDQDFIKWAVLPYAEINADAACDSVGSEKVNCER